MESAFKTRSVASCALPSEFSLSTLILHGGISRDERPCLGAVAEPAEAEERVPDLLRPEPRRCPGLRANIINFHRKIVEKSRIFIGKT